MDPNQTFEGVISGVTEFGIFVEITENNCEGLVRMQDLSNDFYEFDKDNYRIVGQRTKKMYTFGDQVVVRVKETNLARRSMDFALVSDKAGHVTDSGSTGRSSRSGSSRREGSSSRSGSSRSGTSARGSSSTSRSAGTSTSAPKPKRTEGTAPKGENRRGGRGRK
ncbi:MAG TPA: S1 RNA-binding domain-containing protein [Hymenobacter sp.]|nr:S1 RNA-binding domain-containing protein [Hymenobacter sp.]